MKRLSVIRVCFKHVLGLCFFFVLGVLLGLYPLGLLYEHVTGDTDKDVPFCGAMIGGTGLSAAYLLIFLVGCFRKNEESASKEQPVTDLFRLTFWSFVGFLAGSILLSLLYTHVTGDYANSSIQLYGGLVGASCLTVGSIAIRSRMGTVNTARLRAIVWCLIAAAVLGCVVAVRSLLAR